MKDHAKHGEERDLDEEDDDERRRRSYGIQTSRRLPFLSA